MPHQRLPRWMECGIAGAIICSAALTTLRSLHLSLWPEARTTYRADLPTIVEELVNLSRLETASFHGEKVIEARTELQPLPLWMAGDRVMLVAHGTVTAGVDLSRVGSGDVRVRDETVYVRLPHASIFSVQLDDRSYVYDHHPGLFSQVDPGLETTARLKAEETLRDAALTTGLLSRAEGNAHTSVEHLLKAAGARQVVFE